MGRSEYNQFTKEIKSKVAEIIIKFNFLELSIREILAIYIHSVKNDFVCEILLHNSIISFNSKLSILRFITHKEAIKFSVKEDLHSLIDIRNAIAHSDNLFNMEGEIMHYEIVDDEFDVQIPVYEPLLDGPKITLFKGGKINKKGFDKCYDEFNIKLANAEKGLIEIKEVLIRLNK